MIKHIAYLTVLNITLISCSTQNPTHTQIETKKTVSQVKKKGNIDSTTIVNFDFDSATVNRSNLRNINKAVAVLNETPNDYKVIVTGHTDTIGPSSYNDSLGLKRARMIKEILVENGVNENKIEAKSMGEEMPLVDTDNWEVRSKNRRASITIVEVSDQTLPPFTHIKEVKTPRL